MTSNQPFQIMPEMSEADFAALKEDIRQHGVLVPIEYGEDGFIIDGHHRFRAFSELIAEGVDLPMFDKIVRRFTSQDEKISYILSLNMRRRHLTAEQRQQVVFDLRKRFGYTLVKIAEMLGVTAKTISVDLANLTDAEREELNGVEIKSTDGRSFSSGGGYSPRVFYTGQATLRDMQMKAIDSLIKSQPPVFTPPITQEPEPAPAQAQLTITDEEARTRMSAFAWYGGKQSHLNWLLPLLPTCTHFVDLFGGSAAVLLNRAPSPIETYNDIDNNAVIFFRVLRDNTQELLRLLELTPYSREERRDAYRTRAEWDTLPDLERARRFFVLARQTIAGQGQSSRGMLNAWRVTRDVIARGIAGSISQWDTGIDGLAAIASRLKRVQIENHDALHVINQLDSPGTLFYCDPPYLHETRGKSHRDDYTQEMTEQDHILLAEALHKIKGRAAVSGYPSELYNDLYNDWHVFLMPAHAAAHMTDRDIQDRESERIECLWTSYPLGSQSSG